MPRKGPAPKRPVVADPVYGAPIVTQLVNKILLDGKKGLAERIVYGALSGVAEKSSQDPVVLLKKALDNVRPTLEVRSRRVGGSSTSSPSRRSPDIVAGVFGAPAIIRSGEHPRTYQIPASRWICS